MGLLVSLADYKTYAGISGTTNDTRLTALLTSASKAVRNWCDRNATNGFELAERTETYDGTGTGAIRLRERPVTAIASVSWIDADGNTEALDATAYRYEAGTGLLYLIGSRSRTVSAFGDYGRHEFRFGIEPNWGNEPQSVQVVYTAGYTTIPEDLQYVVERIVDGMWADVATNAGMKSESTGAQSYTRMTPTEQREMFAAYLDDYIPGGA